jgi:predicted transcriptional regulator of viral defense system
MLATQKLETLFQKREGLVRRKDALEAGIHPRELSNFVAEGKAERVQRGVYRLVGGESFDKDWLLEVSYRVPKGVVCLLSAMDFHGLSTFVPSDIHLAVPTGSHLPKFEYPSVMLHQFSEHLYKFGVEKHKVGPGTIKVYSPEKTIADLLRFQKRYGLELFLEALKTYWSRKGRSASKLMEAAKVCGVERSMQLYLTAVAA